jgi:hypothetical protein
MQEITRGCKEVQEDTRKYRRLQESIKRMQKIASGCKKAKEYVRKYKGMQEST